MCGRYTLKTAAEKIAELFDLADSPPLAPRYNIAPGQPVAVVRQPPEATQRQLAMLRWGLIPSWAKDESIGNRLINARSETVHEKPSFRNALRQRRCLLPADGFYEWQRRGGGKQPYYIHLGDQRPFAFAGLWETWSSPDGDAIESCTILTTQPNDLLKAIHDRMPVIVPPDRYDLWLDASRGELAELQALFEPWPADLMVAMPVAKLVNSPSNDGPQCCEAIDHQSEMPFEN